MDILEKILNNNELAEKIRLKCDIELYPELQKPDDMDGQITWNIDGKAFGVDGSGGEFILLSDGTIGFNSSEGETGRIAENIKELFSLLVNCPCFFDFLMPDIYKDKILLKKYANKIEKQYKEEFNDIMEYDWDTIKSEIAKELNFSLVIDFLISSYLIAIFEFSFSNFSISAFILFFKLKLKVFTFLSCSFNLSISFSLASNCFVTLENSPLLISS